MISRLMRSGLIFAICSVALIACGDSDQEQMTGSKTDTEKMMSTPQPVPRSTLADNGVVYQEAIYKNWPYTETADTAETGNEPTPEAAEAVVEKTETVPASASSGKVHTINAEARIFNPDTVYIQPGDTVGWTNMTSHNSVSVEGMIPEGAEPWRGSLGENLKITLSIEGVYAYVCEPHIGFGMVGLIIVGNPGNLDEVTKFAQDNLQGPYRRLLGKLIKVDL